MNPIPMMPDYIVPTYSLYLATSVALTVWVARTLSRNGRVFLVDCFRQNEELADSVNHLLVVGFYLVNAGFIALFLKSEAEIRTVREVFEALSWKLGVVLLVLGAMHFLNLAVLARFRKRGLETPPTIPGTRGTMREVRE